MNNFHILQGAISFSILKILPKSVRFANIIQEAFICVSKSFKVVSIQLK